MINILNTNNFLPVSYIESHISPTVYLVVLNRHLNNLLKYSKRVIVYYIKFKNKVITSLVIEINYN